ncbi:putative bifunctional diguanylate cyclase/phosphodiesterase [Rhizorhapis suberifaciens]|uniref:Diguanylate cyclase (GGDEF)-like protein n=1 Tax=Rhizorhapis suberifaciens TaxID=13656 RepID=A0A840HP11_9SPHN|nr:EAL domain-containing protein [Rhizorhapis suberifaciens]MBB4639772.1 diguanylate cyclase (GGDEF)-like protein [Rhizorhapis suberifaciens]
MWSSRLKNLLCRWRAKAAVDAQQNADVRRALVESLYASPTSLTIGAIAGSAVSVAVARVAEDWVLTGLTALICLVATSRVVSATYFHRHMMKGSVKGSRGWELAYELGAWLYAASLGLMACAALIRSENAIIHMLAVSLATGYAGGISGRNAGRVHIAVGQVFLALAPTALGLWLVEDTGYRILSIVLVLMIPGMAEISNTTHRIVLQALTGKQQKTMLAAKFEKLARYDSLTGVENRMAMHMRIRDMFEEGDSSADQLAVLWIDLDRFKEINDSLGHMVGDQLLVSVAEKVGAVLAGRGSLARFGGDEFIILCRQTGRQEAAEIAEDIFEHFRDPFEVGGHNLAVTASIGIAVAPQDGADREEILQHADLALYHAKNGGRNRYSLFEWSMKERLHRVREIEAGLRRAIEQGEFSMRYQPIFDMKTGRVACCEALIRWHHPVLGDVSPGEFIPIAESISMIGPISEWVLGQACAAAAQWPDEIRVAVNISPALLRSGDLPRTVIACLYSSGLKARRLELEVTESVFLEDNLQTSQILRELQRIGLRLALDDFGTGYSSLSYLRSYKFDTIKVDQSFMAGIHKSYEDRAIIQSVAHLASALRMDTVAEGIETADQLRYANEAGFTNVQGYLLCRPLGDAAVSKLLNEQSGKDDMPLLDQQPSVNAYEDGFALQRGVS